MINLKYIHSFLITLLFCILFYAFFFPIQSHPLPVNQTLSLSNQTIVIDPGHGGLDNGASVGKYKEDDINLKIAFKLQKELESRGATVFLTRNDDQDLTMRNYNYSKQDDMYLRVRKIDSYEADLFVSIHLNASPSSSTWGSQVFYYGKSEEAKQLANDVHNSMKKVTGSKKAIESANFYVLRCTKTKGILIECGFLTNKNERGQLLSSKHQEKLSKVIADGIEAYIQRLQTSSHN